MQESGLTETIPLICTSAIWGQYPVFSHPGILCFLPEFPQGSPAHLRGDCDMLCLLIGRQYFISHTQSMVFCYSSLNRLRQKLVPRNGGAAIKEYIKMWKRHWNRVITRGVLRCTLEKAYISVNGLRHPIRNIILKPSLLVNSWLKLRQTFP